MIKKLLSGLSVSIIAVALSTTSFAQATITSPAAALSKPQQPSLIPSPPNINAQAYVLMDVNSGTILAEKNMNQRRAPASLTKLMTLYLTFRAINNNVIGLNDNVLISKKAWRTGGSRMFVKAGSRVPVDKLIQGVIVDSGNDATMALAQYVGGSESTFVNMMNQEAQALNMTGSHFTDPTGLPAPEHYSSAIDLAKLARAIWRDFPQFQHYFSQKWLTFNGIRQPNRNRLLWRYPYALGMKTGHTDAAGYCLISIAKHDGMTLLSVVMGTPTDEDRASDSIALLSYGFRFYTSHLLYQAGSIIAKPRIWFGENKTVPAGSLYNVYVTTPRGQFANAQVSIQTNNDITAPVKKGQTVGNIIVTLHKQQVANYPIVALTNDPKGGLWRRSIDDIEYKLHSWFGSDKSKAPAKPQTTTVNNQTTTQSTQQ